MRPVTADGLGPRDAGGDGGPADGAEAADDEHRLVHAARGGDGAAFNRLVLRYQDAVYTLCFRLTGNTADAADAAQEAFLSAYRHLADFRGGAFRSWVFRIAANASYDLHRRRKRHPTEPLERPESEAEPPASEIADPALGPEAALLRQELAQYLQAGLLELPQDQRLAVVLCDVHAFDYQAIAAITGAELGTVKSRINRGRRRLRDYLLANRELLPATYRLTHEARGTRGE